jgi:hypothetical protein
MPRPLTSSLPKPRGATVRGLCLVSAAFLALCRLESAPGGAADNAILRWNAEALNATRLARNPPPIAAIHLATYHAAIHDAVVSLAGGTTWLPAPPPPEDASAEAAAAAAAAAHLVLKTLWTPSANPRTFDLALERALASLPPGPARERGLRHGRDVAERILSVRARTGWAEPARGPFASTEPGRWRETPPGFRPAVLPQIATVTPFVLHSPSQFRAPPPPSVDSPEHAAELAEVARIGARDGAERTDDQTLTTPFWSDDLGTATPAGHWNVIAQDVARRRGLALVASARLFALLNFATADAAIACWDTKYHYRTWRPETAIRELTPAVNPHHRPRPDFIPNMVSPAHPDYVSGHSAFSGAAARLLARYFGEDAIPFSTSSDGLPDVVRQFPSFSAACEEVGLSRVFGGIHTRSANLAGQEIGRQVADWVFDHAIAPTARDAARAP